MSGPSALLSLIRMRAFAIVLLLAVPFAAIAEVEKAICAVCGPREGSGFEEVKARARYQGRDYAFCSVQCKAEFLKNPSAFLATDEGKPAPPFALTTLQGDAISLQSMSGKVVLLDFWATFCPPCLAALPELQALHAKHERRGFAVVGMTVDDRPQLVKKAVSEAKVTYPIVNANAAVWNAYNVNALPSLVLVGRDGKIIRRYGGEADRKGMLADIEKALAD